MDYLQIALLVLVVVGVWAVVELALTIRTARKVVDELSITANETVGQVQPIIGKVDGIMDELDPTIKQVPELLGKVGATVDSVNGILGDVSGTTGAVATVTSGVSRAATDAVSSVSNAVGRLAGRRRKGKEPKSDAQLKAASIEEKPMEAAAEPAVGKKDYVTYAESAPVFAPVPDDGVASVEDTSE